ncbi:NAD(P)H-binding protein [Dactylosporangium sp. CA-092794]|uniref:NAD(P)H-binding protein n=1 Tax=Dactylosporangium sp. CA-092794 TaxID=3239929 RepID=UPI003D8E13EB
MPILVTGAAGNVGAVGRTVVDLLRRHDLPVRALVHHDDDRADALRAAGAEVVVGDLTRGADVVRALDGCRRVYFAMSVSAAYLQATATVAAAARDRGDLEALVNMSQMTVSQMTLTSTAESGQHRLQWLGERVLSWSGLPVVQIRPTVFLENPLFTTLGLDSIARDGTIRLPFGSARTSPVAARDVAEVVAAVLTDPAPHLGGVYELTGARSQDMYAMAHELSEALPRPVTYVDVPYDRWLEEDLLPLGLPAHVFEHLAMMASLHAAGRYDRTTYDVERLTGHRPTSVAEWARGAHAAVSSPG